MLQMSVNEIPLHYSQIHSSFSVLRFEKLLIKVPLEVKFSKFYQFKNKIKQKSDIYMISFEQIEGSEVKVNSLQIKLEICYV